MNTRKTNVAIGWQSQPSIDSATPRGGEFQSCRKLVCVVTLLCFCLAWPSPVAAETLTIPVFDEAVIEWDNSIEDSVKRDELTIFREGQAIERVIELPALPVNQRDANRIIATLIVEPVVYEEDGKLKPGDPWTRLGNLSVILPGEKPAEIELMRFITGFGGQGTFTQDLTALAPLLQGATTLRLYISTYKKPAWKVTLALQYASDAAGYRRPIWSLPIFNELSVNAENSRITSTIEVPPGLSRPRLRIMSTGHATDGTGGDEFISRTHILRIDGTEVARWRPWAEDAGEMRDQNPMSGRMLIDGRELWSSDLDRSGWRPGAIVEPTLMPVAELTPGKHTIELEILGIRPKDQFNNHGYWRVSCIAIADEPWPEHPEPKKE